MWNEFYDYYAPRLVIRASATDYYYIHPKPVPEEIEVYRAGTYSYSVGAIPYTIPIQTYFNLSVDVITGGSQVGFTLRVNGVPIGTLADLDANRILQVGKAGIRTRGSNTFRVDNFSVLGVPQGYASVEITQPVYDRGLASVEITQEVVIPTGKASVEIKQSIHQGQGQASVEVTQSIEVMSPLVFDPAEVMYDSFSTGGDGALTSHTSESGHTWSAIAGFTDNITVVNASARAAGAVAEGAALCSYAPTSPNYSIAFTNMYIGDSSAAADVGPSLLLRTTDGTDGYRIQYNSTGGYYEVYRQADSSLVGYLSRWDLGSYADTPSVVFHIQNLYGDSQVAISLSAYGYVYHTIYDSSPNRVITAGKVGLILKDANFNSMTIIEDAYRTVAYDSFERWGTGGDYLENTADALGFPWKKQTGYSGDLAVDATGFVRPSTSAPQWMYYTFDDADYPAEYREYGVYADITLNDVATNTQVPALTLYTHPDDGSHKWLNVIPQPLTNEIIVVHGTADGGVLKGSVPYTFSAGVQFRLHAQIYYLSYPDAIINIFVDNVYVDTVYTSGIDWFYGYFPGVAGYQQGTWEIEQWGQTYEFLTVPPPQGSVSFSITQSIQDYNRYTQDTFTVGGGDVSLADHLSDDGFYWHKSIANWDADTISVIDANDRVRGPGGNGAWLWYWLDVLPMDADYSVQADIRTESKGSDTYSVQLMLRASINEAVTSWYYVYPRHKTNKIEIRRLPSLTLGSLDYSFPTSGTSRTIRAEVQTFIDRVDIRIYVDDTLIGTVSDTSAERLLEAGRPGLATTQNATADNFTFSVLRGQISLGITQDIADRGYASVEITQDVVIPQGYASVDIYQRVVSPGFASVGIEQRVNHGIGIASVAIQQIVKAEGYASVEITQDLVIPQGSVSLGITNVIQAPSGYVTVFIEQVTTAQGQASVGITQTITNIQGIASVDIQQVQYATGGVSVSILQSIADPVALTTDNVDWKAKVTLDGVDISEDITGEIRVEAEENGSRIAEFVFDPAAGLLEIMEWVASQVTIDYQIRPAGSDTFSTHRIFTGIVDVPAYDPVTQLVSIHATDHLQGRFEQATKEDIEAMVGGEWSRHVFNEEVDGWQYFQDRMSTQPYSFDLDINGTGVKAAWEAKATPDFTYVENTIDDESVTVEFASRRDIINKGLINLDFRFQRMRERRHNISWELYPGFLEYLYDPFLWPTRSMCESAVSGGGWVLESIVYIDPPQSGVYQVRNRDVPGSHPRVWVLNPGFKANYCQGFFAKVSNKWAQTITEEYEFEVICQQSIDQLGPIHEEFDYGIECEQDITDWEDTEDPGFSISAAVSDGVMASGGSIAEPWEGEEYLDADETDIENGRAEMENAQVCALEIAKTSILNTHRNNYVEFSTFLEPGLERHHTVYVNTAHVQAKGKTHGFIHTMNPDGGIAITEVRIAISKVLASGLPFASPVTPAPKPDTTPDQSIITEWGGLGTHIGGRLASFPYNEDMRGLTTNYEWDPDTQDHTSNPLPQQVYPYEFVIETPEIEEEARQPVIGSSTITVHVEVPDELMDITTT
ncbi:MAG: hypothetical protein KAJ73_00330 [Zetaproteobacteria bacterium]|nr:hypothetical protein [Zetaproteobacteria bacterium]